MLCQNCKINDATIHLYTNLNGKQQQVDLCHNCYQIMKTDPNNAILKGLGVFGNPNDIDPFSEFFNNIGGYPGNTPAGRRPDQTPPTQAGRTGGGNQNGGRGPQRLSLSSPVHGQLPTSRGRKRSP